MLVLSVEFASFTVLTGSVRVMGASECVCMKCHVYMCKAKSFRAVREVKYYKSLLSANGMSEAARKEETAISKAFGFFMFGFDALPGHSISAVSDYISQKHHIGPQLRIDEACAGPLATRTWRHEASVTSWSGESVANHKKSIEMVVTKWSLRMPTCEREVYSEVVTVMSLAEASLETISEEGHTRSQHERSQICNRAATSMVLRSVVQYVHSGDMNRGTPPVVQGHGKFLTS